MKIAVIQDQLLTQSGSERVFHHIIQEFKEADAFTFAYNPELTWPEFKKESIKRHPLGGFVKDHDGFKNSFLIAAALLKRWDFSRYDIIISSSATVGKYVSNHKALHVCYCYYPTRAIWEPDKYFGSSKTLKTRVFKLLNPYLKRQDLEAARKINKFIAISQTTRCAIKKYYGRDSDVLFSPVNTNHFNRFISCHKEPYYLIVSRLEKWKNLEYAIDAFNRLGMPLKVIGVGPEQRELEQRSKQNIQFLGSVTDIELGNYYARAKAVIFTPELEYGLVPLEALASGTPVIALGRGGVLETLGTKGVDGKNRPIAILFQNPTSDDVVSAVNRFERCRFDQSALVRFAERFSVEEFQRKMRLALVREIQTRNAKNE